MRSEKGDGGIVVGVILLVTLLFCIIVFADAFGAIGILYGIGFWYFMFVVLAVFAGFF